MSRVVRPRSVALFGLACLAVAVALGLLQLAEPVFWVIYTVAILSFIAAYGYLAVSFIGSGRKWVGWGLAWVPMLLISALATPPMGIVTVLFVSIIEAVVLVGAVMLALRIGRWASVRYNLPYPA